MRNSPLDFNAACGECVLNDQYLLRAIFTDEFNCVFFGSLRGKWIKMITKSLLSTRINQIAASSDVYAEV